jgi:hypothetical protein
MKSVKTINSFKFSIQIIFDLVDAEGGERKVENKDYEGASLIINFKVV